MRNTARLAALVLSAALALTGCGSTDSNVTAETTFDIASPSPTGTADRPDGNQAFWQPWPAPPDAANRAASAGLTVGPMGTAKHFHLRLRVLVKGRAVQIPANIGVDTATGAMSSLHTHEEDGTLHVESGSTSEIFTLGQVFTQWGVQFTPAQVGEFRAPVGRRVVVTVNGKRVPRTARDVRLRPDQSIVVRVP